MTEVYKSKVGFAIILPLGILCAMFMVALVFKLWLGVVILGCAVVFILHMFFNTYYTITGAQLLIKSGFVINITMDIGSIKKITPTNSILSSPALSMDRLDIAYNKYDNVMVSPKDKTGFITRLIQINPSIKTT